MDEKVVEYKVKGYIFVQVKVEVEIWVVVLGISEYQFGFVVDINVDGIYLIGNEVYRWLDENSYCFGFICCYLLDKIEIIGVSNELWYY